MTDLCDIISLVIVKITVGMQEKAIIEMMCNYD